MKACAALNPLHNHSDPDQEDEDKPPSERVNNSENAPLPTRAGHPATAKDAFRASLEGDAENGGEEDRPSASLPDMGNTYGVDELQEEEFISDWIRHPEEFGRYGGLIQPSFFASPEAVAVVHAVQNLLNKHGHMPQFSTLANYVLGVSHYETEQRKACYDYVKRLEAINSPDWKIHLGMVTEFIRQKAMMSALTRCAESLADERVKLPPGGMSELLARAEAVGKQVVVEGDADLATASIPESEPVIEGLIDQGMVAVCAGASKSHKTWLNMMVANSIAYTGDWLGFRCRKGPVLYVNFELTRKVFQTRMLSVQKALGVKPTNQIDVLHMKGEEVSPATFLAGVRSLWQQKKYVTILIDPLYAMEVSSSGKGHDGDNTENNNSAMGKVMFRFIELATRCQCAVWVTTHFGKGNQASKEMLDRLVGGGVQGRALDTAITMTKHKATDKETGDRAYTLEFETRNHREVKPFAVRWQYPLLVQDPELDPAELAQSIGRPAEHRALDLLKALSTAGMTNKQWLGAAGELGIGQRTYYTLKAELVRVALVMKDENDLWFPDNDRPI